MVRARLPLPGRCARWSPTTRPWSGRFRGIVGVHVLSVGQAGKPRGAEQAGATAPMDVRCGSHTWNPGPRHVRVLRPRKWSAALRAGATGYPLKSIWPWAEPQRDPGDRGGRCAPLAEVTRRLVEEFALTRPLHRRRGALHVITAEVLAGGAGDRHVHITPAAPRDARGAPAHQARRPGIACTWSLAYQAGLATPA